MSVSRSFPLYARVTIFCFATTFIFYACSLPRIVILNDPLSSEEHMSLGRIYESQGKLDLAEQQYREAVKKEPKSVSALLLLGDLSFQAKKYTQAETAYRKAIKLQPENGDIYNNLCLVYLEQNAGIDKTEDLIRKAIAVTPEHRAYYLDTLGTIFLKQGRIADAIGEYKKAIELLPADNAAYLAEAYGHLAEAYRVAGYPEKAREAEQSAAQCHSQQ